MPFKLAVVAAFVLAPVAVAATQGVATASESGAFTTASAPADSTPGSGTVYVWGGRISHSPEKVQGLPAAVDIQAANWGGLSVDAPGRVWQWSQPSHDGGKLRAVEEIGPSNVVSIGEGYWFSAAVDSAGDVWTWGDNSKGDLCQGTDSGTVKKPAKTTITGAKVVTGGAHRLAVLLTDGRVVSCGSDQFGQFGNRKFDLGSSVPVYADIRHVVELSAGDTTDVALESDGTVWAWGQGNYGEIGNGGFDNVDVPTEVDLPGPATEVYGGGDLDTNGSELALLSDGSVWAWGDDREGQLGPDGNGTADATPVKVPFPKGTVITWAGMAGDAGFALDSKGDLWAWGSDGRGQQNGDGSLSAATPAILEHGCQQVSVVAGKVVVISTKAVTS